MIRVSRGLWGPDITCEARAGATDKECVCRQFGEIKANEVRKEALALFRRETRPVSMPARCCGWGILK